MEIILNAISDPGRRAATTESLRRAGYEVLDAPAAAPGGGRPALLLLDANHVDMPAGAEPAEVVRAAVRALAEPRIPPKIAHDLNNALAAIAGYGHIALQGCPEGAPNHEELVALLDATKKAWLIVQGSQAATAPSQAAARPHLNDAPHPDAAAAEQGPGTADGTVLLMDDEAEFCDLAGRIIRRLGFGVEFALHGDEALERVRRRAARGEPYAAAILDLNIPGGKGGRDIVRALRELAPTVPVLAASGATADPAMTDPGAHGFTGAMHKPVGYPELEQEIRRALGCATQEGGGS